jgi:hypothetical protein
MAIIQIPPAAPPFVRIDQANTYTAGDQSMTSAASLEVPNAGGATAGTTSGRINEDTAQKVYNLGEASLGNSTIVRVLPVQTPANDVINATDAGATTGIGLAFTSTFNIPASYLITGKIFRVTYLVQIVGSVGAPSLTYTLVLEKAGPVDVNIYQSGANAPVAGVTRGASLGWIVMGTAAAGAAAGVLTEPYGIPGNNGSFFLNMVNQLNQTVAVDTTVQETVKLFILYSAATAANSITVKAMFAEVLN